MDADAGTKNAAFCFAFVHQSVPPQTLCDAAGSTHTAEMRIGGEPSDDGLTQPVLFTCGFTTGPAGCVVVDGDKVVGTLTDIGSGLSGFCVQLPEGVAAGASFTVSTQVVISYGPKNISAGDVTATYP